MTDRVALWPELIGGPGDGERIPDEAAQLARLQVVTMPFIFEGTALSGTADGLYMERKLAFGSAAVRFLVDARMPEDEAVRACVDALRVAALEAKLS